MTGTASHTSTVPTAAGHAAAREVVGYDVVGDVHGDLPKLEGLLTTLGYSCIDGVWGHPDRTAVFVGDLVDRGAHQVGTVQTVRAMVEAGTALMVLGNHEFNAMAWTVPNPDPHRKGEFVRRHKDANREQHAAFLDQVGEGSAQHHRILAWFYTLPLWLELSLGDRRLRVVHACWHEESIAGMRPYLTDSGALTLEGVVAARTSGPAHDFLEVLLKGPEVHMAGRVYVMPKDIHKKPRHHARRRWWRHDATTLDEIGLVPSTCTELDGSPFGPLAAVPVPDGPTYRDDVPLIVGHYWASPDEIELYSPFVACVDYSAAAGGPLVAYRWDGEAVLDVGKYVRFDG